MNLLLSAGCTRAGCTDPCGLESALRPKVEAKLGRDDHLVTQRGKRFANKFFVHERAVHLRRIEEGDTPFDCAS